MYICKSCKAVLTVDIEGNASVVVHEPMPIEQEPEPVKAKPAAAHKKPKSKAPPPPEPEPEPETELESELEQAPEPEPVVQQVETLTPPQPDLGFPQLDPFQQFPVNQNIEAPGFQVQPFPAQNFDIDLNLSSPSQESPQQPPSQEQFFEQPTTEVIPQETPQENESVYIEPAEVAPVIEKPNVKKVEIKLVREAFELTGFQKEHDEILSPKMVFTEIAQFANELESSGLPTYSIFLENIEAHKESVYKVLLNEKFGWSQSFLKSRTFEDQIELRKVNPAQAVMVVKLLQSLPIQISWRQDDF
jgi:hypothetical protein